MLFRSGSEIVYVSSAACWQMLFDSEDAPPCIGGRCRTINMRGKRPRHDEMGMCRQLPKWLLDIPSACWGRQCIGMVVGERKRMGHTVTQHSTIPKQAVSGLLRGVSFLLKTDTNMSDFVRIDAVCRFFCRVSDLKSVSRCRLWYILLRGWFMTYSSMFLSC